MKKKYVVLLILLAVGGVWLAVRAANAGAGKWRERARQAEKAKAEAEGQLVAEQATAAEMRTLAASLSEQVDELEAVIGERPTVRTVVRRETNPIDVELQRLVGDRGRMIDDLNETIRALNLSTGSDCPECPTIDDIFRGRDVFRFKVVDVSAILESDAGNRFIVGEVDLGLVAPEELAGHLGTATYRADVSEFFDSGPPEPPEVQRWYAGIHYAFHVESEDVTLAQYIFDDVPNTITQRFTPDRWRLYAGIRLFPRASRSWRVGLWGDSRSAGADFGISW